MKITDLIDQLTKIREEHGDLDVVHGIDQTGYGNVITNAEVQTGETEDGNELNVVDLAIDDESLVAVGGF